MTIEVGDKLLLHLQLVANSDFKHNLSYFPLALASFPPQLLISNRSAQFLLKNKHRPKK